jgi:hypothetical protein
MNPKQPELEVVVRNESFNKRKMENLFLFQKKADAQ